MTRVDEQRFTCGTEMHMRVMRVQWQRLIRSQIDAPIPPDWFPGFLIEFEAQHEHMRVLGKRTVVIRSSQRGGTDRQQP